ncbi:MAG: cation:proton antiporter [Chloroflexi bacterium]|nr:cation:proton antiporter [Chloroflexota bacterium]
MDEITELITRLVFQLAVILLAAKLAGEACERYLKVPSVLGELVVGIIIGPYALGGLSFGGIGPLFQIPNPSGDRLVVPVSSELYALAQVASVVLLFVVGLETDARLFLRYGVPGLVVAAGGVALPFFLGAYATVSFGFADHFASPESLFMGAILTATSIGITARVLSSIGKLGTPEGVTVMAAAVIDDVLGILVLTIVAGVVATGTISTMDVAKVGAKTVVFWVALTGIGFLLSRFISRFLLSFRVAGAGIAISLAIALFASGLAEIFGLALIIGAYSAGLALSGTRIARELEHPANILYNTLVPIFFVVMGMMVDLTAVRGVLFFGIVLSFLAIVGKVLGSGIPALGVGFKFWGGLRIGVGMVPRAEVALIMAGIGLTRGVVSHDLYGVAIMMTIITTLLAPVVLVWTFSRGGSGTRKAEAKVENR